MELLCEWRVIGWKDGIGFKCFFLLQLEGATYMDVHKAGGGINYTVEKVRQASEDELYQPFKTFLKVAAPIWKTKFCYLVRNLPQKEKARSSCKKAIKRILKGSQKIWRS